MALHSGTRHPLNPAVGDVITSLGWSNQVAVAAGQQRPLFFPCVFETIREVHYGSIPTSAGVAPQLRIALASLRCVERTGRPTISNAIPVVFWPFTSPERMGFRTPWGLPRSVSSPLLLPWQGSLCRSYTPIDGLVTQLRRQ